MTDQPQSGPPEGADVGSGPAGDMTAALGPDAPAEAPSAAPPPPAAIAAAMDGQDVEKAAAVAPLEPGDSPTVSPPPVPPASDWRPEADPASGGPAALAAERPEIAVGAAFAGGLVLALILKRLAR